MSLRQLQDEAVRRGFADFDWDEWLDGDRIPQKLCAVQTCNVVTFSEDFCRHHRGVSNGQLLSGAAVKAEREACALVAEQHEAASADITFAAAQTAIAAAIRARSDK